MTIEQVTDDAATIRRQAGLCLKRVDLSRRIRLLGVRVGKLVKPGEADTIVSSPTLAVREPALPLFPDGSTLDNGAT